MNNLPRPFSTDWYFIYLKTILFLILIICAIKLILFQSYSIPSSSMEPTLLKGDKIIATKLIYKIIPPKKNDIVIFKLSKNLKENNKKNTFFLVAKGSKKPIYIKRVIAVENDILEIKNGKVFINNKPITENYIKERPYYEYPKTKVPSGKLFVLGDNRNNSKDSHLWGCINKKDIIGKALFVFSPMSRIKLLK